MANKLTDEKRAEMFAVWCEKQSYESVSRKCEVAHQTARRYCKKDNWVERHQKIYKKAADKVDNEIAKMKAKHAKFGQILQQMFQQTFIKNGKLDIEAVKKLDKKDLIKALESGIKMEREALGESETIIVKDYDGKSVDELQKIMQELEQQEKELKG